MFDDIAPGSAISVKIVRQPTNASAIKTLVRLFCKDETVATENKRLDKVRRKNFRWTPRGGRQYPIHMVKLRPVKGNVGESAKLVASVDVLADLKSVGRFVEVTGA